MKNSTLKLAIRRETLRALAQLDVARVAGGKPDAPQLARKVLPTGCQVVQAAVPPKQ